MHQTWHSRACAFVQRSGHCLGSYKLMAS